MCCENKFKVENHILVVCANKLIIYLNMCTITIKIRIIKAFIIIFKRKSDEYLVKVNMVNHVLLVVMCCCFLCKVN
jgi:hypothetical protein